MKQIKSVRVTGFFDVNGVVNYNGVESRNGNNNHLGAKRNSLGVDYTSSNCLRQAMFSEYIPRQPCSEEAVKQYPEFAGSVAGILRGGMDASSQTKAKSPIMVSDAYTVGDQSVFYEQLTSSKPKEAGKKNKKGEEVSDTSVFSRDNSGRRKQLLDMEFRISDIQLQEIGDNGKVKDKNKDVFTKSLQNSLEMLGVSNKLNEGTFKYATAQIPSTRTGVLLTDEQVSAFVLEFLRLVQGIEVYRRSSSLTVDVDSLKVEFVNKDNVKETFSLAEAKELLKTAKYQQFWE